MKRVFFFGNGRSEGAGLGKERLGGKGFGLAEMTALGIPVPPGFTIEAAVSAEYSRGADLGELKKEVARSPREGGIRRRAAFGRPREPAPRFGAVGRAFLDARNDGHDPEPRPDPPRSRAWRGPGERFALDCRAGSSRCTGTSSCAPGNDFEHALTAKAARGVASDAELSAADLADLVRVFEEIIRKHTGREFPEEPQEQLWGAIEAVFRSWDNERAKTYRRLHRIPEDWGTAVNVQAMVFGNRGETSATGVAFTRDPSTGEKRFYGEFLPNAQGEDVVAGIRTPRPLNATAPGSRSKRRCRRRTRSFCA